MSARLTQTQRVLRLLEQRGERGITAADLLPPVVDGLKPVGRLAARIDELRSRGLHIVTDRKGGGYARYILREPQRVAAAASAAPCPADPATLAAALALPLDIAAPAQRSPLDPWEAA
jgi:hypothetical protein